MRLKQAIGALFQALVIMVFFSLALLFIFLEEVPYLRFQVVDNLLHHPEKFRFFGFGLLLSTCLITACWKAMHQNKNIHLKMGVLKVSLGNKLLKSTLSRYMGQTFQNRFSLVKISSDDGKKLEIHLRALPNSLPVDEESLLKIEQELSQFLAQRLGYTGEFFLRIETEEKN